MSDFSAGSVARPPIRFSSVVPAISDVRMRMSRNPIGSGSFTRALADSAGRPFRGQMLTTGLTARENVDPGLLNLGGIQVSAYFARMTAYVGSERIEIPLRLENGQTAKITGNSAHQNIRSRTRTGVVLEANISSRGAEAVRGFRTPQELNTFLDQILMARDWAEARALPNR